jgi:NAD(P)-dependent dehydrogenase (short-subunit alcohol dehydrogenase family)
VPDGASVAVAARTIEAGGGLDVLVNNAGIEGRTPDNGVIGAAGETAGHVQALFGTNVFGMVRMLHAFLPLLQRSAAPVVVNLSSGLSRTAGLASPDGPLHFYPGVACPASKTAVNMVTVQYAKAFPASGSTPWTPAIPPPTSMAAPAPRPSRRVPGSSSGWPGPARTVPPAGTSTPAARWPGNPADPSPS